MSTHTPRHTVKCGNNPQLYENHCQTTTAECVCVCVCVWIQQFFLSVSDSLTVVLLLFAVNWCSQWFEYFPNPPLNVLAMLENCLAHHDATLLEHFIKHNMTSQVRCVITHGIYDLYLVMHVLHTCTHTLTPSPPPSTTPGPCLRVLSARCSRNLIGCGCGTTSSQTTPPSCCWWAWPTSPRPDTPSCSAPPSTTSRCDQT